MMLSDDEIKTDWTLRYDDRLWDSHLQANARIRELEANICRWFLDHRKLSEAFIRQCDRADQLAVVADALAVECGRLTALIDVLSDNSRRDAGMFVTAQSDAWEQESIATHAKAKLQELVEAAEEKDRFFSLEEPGLPDSKERNDFCDAKFRAWERYQAALEAAKDG